MQIYISFQSSLISLFKSLNELPDPFIFLNKTFQLLLELSYIFT